MMRFMIRSTLYVIASTASLPTGAQLAEGLNYIELNPPQLTTDSNRIVVTEFFSYQCPHCYSFDPVLERWVAELPSDVLFERVAISIGYQQWAPTAQAYFALQAMGQLDARHTAIFRAIHVGGESLYDRASIVQWIRSQNVDSAEFSGLYDSFSISSAVRRGEQRSIAHRVDSVPTLTIDGRYRVSIGDDGTVEHFERQLAGVSELIAAIRIERGL